MIYATDNDEDMNRLADAVNKARIELQPFRIKREMSVRQYVGANYSNYGSTSPVPVNLVELLINVLMSNLGGQRPRATVNTEIKDYRPVAYRFERALNQRLERMRFENAYQRWIRDAGFLIGIMKVGVAQPGANDIDHIVHEDGEVFAEPVDFDDFVCDTSARTWDEMDFCGNKYRVLYDEVMESDLYTKKFKADLVPELRRVNINEAGDTRASAVGVGPQGSNIRYRGYVEFWDLWMPKQRKLITMHANTQPGGRVTGRIAREVNWKGAPDGPYIPLMFNEVPGYVLPLSPVANVYDLHDLANILFNKCADQASRQKSIMLYDGSDLPKAERIIWSRDGQAVLDGRKDSISEVRFGGVDGPTWGMYGQVKAEFKEQAGNLDLEAGLGPQSPTAAQDSLLNANAGKRMDFMQAKVLAATERVMTAIGWYIWHNPGNIKFLHTIPNTKLQVELAFNKKERVGDIYDYNIHIEPYSHQYRSPQAKLAALMQLVSGVYIPLAPVMQQQGITIDFNKLTDLISRYSGLGQELSEVISHVPQPGLEQSDPMEMTQSPVTSRTNTRISRSAQTNRGRADQMASMMMNGRQQPNQVAAAMRRAG